MRASFATTALCGAIAASAAALPPNSGLPILRPIEELVDELVDLTPFESGGFELISPQQAKADAEKPDHFDPFQVFWPHGHDHGHGHGGGGKAAGHKPGSTSQATGAPELASPATPTPTPAVVTPKKGCSGFRERKEWRNVPDADKLAFVNAIKCLMRNPSAGNYPGSKSRWEDLVSVHQQLTPKIHMVGQFLPWHRYYLSIFESILRQECSFNGTLPWWDETKDAGHFSTAPMFTDAYLGRAPVKTNDGRGTCVNSGLFKGTVLHIGPGSNFTDHCLSRAVDESLTSEVTMDFVKSCNAHANYTNMESCAEMGPHAYGHNGIGAVMGDVASSPGDPSFFLHHAFVDHNWRIWQNKDVENRLYQIGGFTTQGGNTPVTLDYVLTSNGLRPDVKVRDVMDTMGGYLCYAYDY
ncbi:hypothetical protein VTK73DRAFT_3881 [Phialemonium thermophilum]|uniref:Tyrosinase copper-binding domain-containing protein n=1 Tax=Phialemonium thermophilum TaxID=223376 RepID=A0ABR3WWZ9_9PEZI